MRKPAFSQHYGWFIGLSLILLAGIGAGQAKQARPALPASTPTPAPATPVPLALVKPDATIPVPAGFSMSVTPDGVWLTDRTKQAVARLDPKTNAPAAPIPLPGPPCGPGLLAFRTLWVTLCDRETILRLDPGPGSAASAAPAPTPTPAPVSTPAGTPASTPTPAALPAPGKPVMVKTPGGGLGVLASGAGSVWSLLSTKGTIARIDPDSNTVVALVSLVSGADAMTFANDALWVVSTSNNVLTRLNGNSNVVMKTIKVGESPVAIASGAGSLWVLNAGDGTVSRVDPAADKVAETIKLGVTGGPSGTGSIVFAEGSVWLSLPRTPLLRIDPVSNRVVQRFTGPGGGTLAAGLKSLWLAVSPTELWRIDPKRVEATR